VRWTIRDPERYLFQIRTRETIREVAESAMRAVAPASRSTSDRRAAARSSSASQVMQQLLTNTRRVSAGRGDQQSDTPAAVNDAFRKCRPPAAGAKLINDARAYALQAYRQGAGEAAAFDKVYVQYKLAPEVTRARMYYETMERVFRKWTRRSSSARRDALSRASEIHRRAPARRHREPPR
jgi:membrane protease subunit HflK